MDKYMTFEEANRALEETVSKLEDKSISLDESMALYAEACELLAFCVKSLDSYKGKIMDIHKMYIEKKGEEQ